MGKILITSALPYANGTLHFGHLAGAYLPADCYARFKRLTGSRVLFVCGSDEYGVAITLSAELEGRTPQQHVDHYHALNKKLFQDLDFSFDHFSRTTWKGHGPTVIEFFEDLKRNGFIEERETEQLYSEGEGRFLADRYVVGICPRCSFEAARGDECPRCGGSFEATDLKEPRSKLTGQPLVRKPTRHLFLRFDKFKEKLSAWLETKTTWKPNVLHFAKTFAQELKPRAITRDSSWGIPVPGMPGKVFYVWFDAPIGYISACKEWDQEKWKDFWLDAETKYVQFIGKDNIPFHAVFFPAMCMGQDVSYKLVDELPANEFYNLEGEKFSKSEGWTIDVEEALMSYTSDQIRYMLAATAPETNDAQFSWKEFQLRCNSDLLGKFGNLASRTLLFAQTLGLDAVPEGVDEEAIKKMSALFLQIRHAYDHFQLRRACSLIMELAHLANVYFDAEKPWVLAKEPTQQPKLHAVLRTCMEALKLLAIATSPIVPRTSEKLWKMLGYTKPCAQWDEPLIPAKQPLGEPMHLFQRIEDVQIDREVERLRKMTEKAHMKKEKKMEMTTGKEAIDITQIDKLDLRVGEIKEVERVPKSKRLLKVRVDIGDGVRTIVAGIGEHMEDPTVLIGRRVLVVANMKPATLMGVESQGMLLAARHTTGFELPDFQIAPPGTSVS